MTEIDKIKDAMREVLKEHHCIVFDTEEDRVMARDIVKTGKRLKIAVISSIVVFLLGGIGVSGYVAAKVDSLSTKKVVDRSHYEINDYVDRNGQPLSHQPMRNGLEGR